MINVTKTCRDQIANDNNNFEYELRITLSDGTVLDVDNSKIWENGLSYEEATSSNSSFDIGGAVTGKLNLVLNNIDGEYSTYDFQDATVQLLHIVMTLDDGTKETIARSGMYVVDEPSYDGFTISLSCLGYMSKFNHSYSMSSLAYPATLLAIVQDACSCCGISLADNTFLNADYSVQTKPTDDITFKDVIAMAAQMAGCYAWINADGSLTFKWYDTTTETYDESAESRTYDILHNVNSLTVGTDDVVVTGLRVTASSEDVDYEDRSELYGDTGYVLYIKDNEFIGYEDVETFSNSIGPLVTGMRFRAVQGEVLLDPTIEAGDLAFIFGADGTVYKTYITDLKYSVGSGVTISCKAKSVRKNSSQSYDRSTSVLNQSKKYVAYANSRMDAEVETLNSKLNSASGLYSTEQDLADGSVITYLHDKKEDFSTRQPSETPVFVNSKVVIKVTADAIGISQNGGQSYPYGMKLDDGTAILNKIYAVGINASYVHLGAEGVSVEEAISEENTAITNLQNSQSSLEQSTASQIDSLSAQIASETQARESSIASTKEIIQGSQDMIDQLNTKVNPVLQALDFNEDTGLIISKPGADVKIQITNEEIDFLVGGVKHAYISSEGFVFEKGVITESLTIGPTGKWIWAQSESGHFRLITNG